ncbi:MAG: protein kinase, partial [Planctomycetota bacterium]
MGTGGKFEAKSLVGLTLDQFEVKSEIARGGMGVVYKGYQPSLDRWVAIKTLPIDLAGDRELVSRFQREAKAMAALNHNNIVQCIHSGESAGQYYIAMEYVEGPSVKDLLKSPTIETDKIFDILAQTCDGLEYAHKKGLVHRDIKPANLLYEEKTGCVKIADFGIAHFSKKDEDMLTLTADNVGMGTMNYMAPEQKINAKGVDHRADIYALGVIVYEAFTGKLPLGKFKLPSEVNPKLPSALDDVVTRCLSTEPADRFGSCSEVKNVLLDAKAATNDKSIRRSMRDAIDRTLTAVLPNKTARYAFVGCFFVAIVAAVVGFGGFMIFRASKGKTRDALVVQVAAAKEAADKAAAGGPLGEGAKMKLSDGEAAIKKADEASQKKDVDAQIGELRKALDAYSSAVEAVNRDKAERAGQDKARLEEQAKELAKKVDARKAEVDALPDDGFKTAALAAIEDARKAQTAKDQDAVAKALTAAAQQVSNSKTTDENVASLRKSAESLKEKKAEGDKLVEDVLALRKKGEIEAINAAVEAARTKLKELGGQEAEIKKPPIEKTPDKTPDKTPETNPTASEDPKLVAASANAEEGARDARKQAKDVVDYASKLALEAGKAERAQAEEAFESVPGKPLAQRAAAYDEARKKFDGARDAALKGIQDALATAKADASSAKELAAEAWHDAEKAASDSETALEPARKAALLGEAVLKYRVAGNQANAAAKEKALKVRATAEAARADAVRRVGDKHSSLAPGDDLLAKGAAAKPADALALYEQAAAAFGGADFGPPKRLGFEATATSKRMVFIKDCADVIAGCPTGFVIAKALTITLYGNDLTQRTSMQAQSIVRALA